MGKGKKTKYFSHLICESGTHVYNEHEMEPKEFKKRKLSTPRITKSKDGHKQVIAYGETLEEATEKAVEAIELDEDGDL